MTADRRTLAPVDPASADLGLLHAVFEQSPFGMALVDPTGHFVRVNPALCALTGYSEDELLERTFQDITHPEDVDADVGQARRVFAGEIDSYEMEKRYLRRTGEVVWVLLSGSVIRDEDGRPIVGLAQIQDITDRRAREQAIRESQALHRTMARNFPHGSVAVFDRDLRYQIAGGSSLEARGIDPADIEGRTLHEIVAPDLSAVLEPAFRRALAGESSELELEQRDRVFTLRVLPLRDEAGEIFAGMVVAQDVTRERMSARASERLASLVNSADDAIIAYAPDNVITDWNPGAERLFGYTREEAIGQRLGLIVPEEAEADVREIIQRLGEGQPIVSVEAIRKRKDGTLIPVSLTVSPVRDAAGAFVGISVIARDETERHRAQAELRASLEEKDVLLREVHHRVKNNLQIVSSLLRMQTAQADPAERMLLQQSRDRIRAMALIHDKLHRAPDLAAVEFGAYARELAAAVVEGGSGPAARVTLDDAGVETVFLPVDTAVPAGLALNELLTNARQHAFVGRTSGVVRLSVACREGVVRIVVHDDGVGMGDVDPAHPGLGLELVQSLAEQLHGTCRFEGPPGVEAVVEFPAPSPSGESP